MGDAWKVKLDLVLNKFYQERRLLFLRITRKGHKIYILCMIHGCETSRFRRLLEIFNFIPIMSSFIKCGNIGRILQRGAKIEKEVFYSTRNKSTSVVNVSMD